MILFFELFPLIKEVFYAKTLLDHMIIYIVCYKRVQTLYKSFGLFFSIQTIHLLPLRGFQKYKKKKTKDQIQLKVLLSRLAKIVQHIGNLRYFKE